MNTQFKFKTEYKDAEQRKQMSEKIKQIHPDKIPIIIEKDPNCKLKDLEKTKYIIPRDLVVAQLIGKLSKKAEIGEKEGLFLLIDGKTAISGNTSLGDIYEKYADEKDGFLYIIYTSKEVWGGL